jgi:hypothetical protein
MIRQDRKSWEKGRADAARGTPSKCPKGFDELAYASGYIEGNAEPCCTKRGASRAIIVRQKKRSRFLLRHLKEGRVFILAGDIVTCHADAAEFTDNDGEHVVLPYTQIATVEIGND